MPSSALVALVLAVALGSWHVMQMRTPPPSPYARLPPPRFHYWEAEVERVDWGVRGAAAESFAEWASVQRPRRPSKYDDNDDDDDDDDDDDRNAAVAMRQRGEKEDGDDGGPR